MLADLIGRLDVQVFNYVESQTTDGDRRSLLAVHGAIARAGPFSYLEIGSYRGGTLQAVIADPRCTRVVSIDPRPQSQPDERFGHPLIEYPDNSVQRMRDLLGKVPGADLAKLETIEDSTGNITPERVGRPDYCFIDGEHTRAAVRRDARFCRTIMRGEGIVVFHDLNIVEPAILDFLRETRPHRAYALQDLVFVVELGNRTLLDDPGVRGQLRPRRGWIIANHAGVAAWLVALDVRRRRRVHARATGLAG